MGVVIFLKNIKYFFEAMTVVEMNSYQRLFNLWRSFCFFCYVNRKAEINEENQIVTKESRDALATIGHWMCVPNDQVEERVWKRAFASLHLFRKSVREHLFFFESE